ncbi:MAG: DoxX protein [Cyanobacteria bacterium J06553_1]
MARIQSEEPRAIEYQQRLMRSMEMKPLLISLAIMRFSIGLFFVIWAAEKIIAPEITQEIFSTFYRTQLSNSLAFAIGLFQLFVILAFMLGLFKTWSYGLLLGMHLVSTLSVYKQLLNPYEPPNYLLWAAVPLLGSLIALFILRDRDQLFTLPSLVTRRGQ